MNFAVILLVCFAVAVSGNQTVEEKLAAALFKDYNKNVNPHSTPLSVGFSYMCADINKANLRLTSRLLEKFSWMDNRLTWDPKSYDNINVLRYPANLLWTPDFKLYNSQHEVETRDEVNAVIYSNGTILWIPIATYHSNCLPLRRNTFHCELKLGSWTFSANTLGLTTDEKSFDKYMYLDTCQFDIIEPKLEVKNQTYPCCPDEPYGSVNINFILQDRV